MRYNKLWLGVAALVASWLLWMTLRPVATVSRDLALLTQPAVARGISLFWLIDVAGNVAVFVPLGASVALAPRDAGGRGRLLWGTSAGVLLSAAIEGAQLALPSRTASLSDWALNVLGAAIGALGALLARRFLRSLSAIHE